MRSIKNVRLPRHYKPERYEISVKPDLKKFTFTGEETIFMSVEKPDNVLKLHSKEIEVDFAEYVAGKKSYWPKISYDLDSETVIFKFKEKLPKGKGDLYLKFRGVLNDKLHGFYRSEYEHEGKKQFLATTQFESTFARQAFPCFDEPAVKAIFDVTIMVPKGLTAISNTLPVKEWQHNPKYQAVKFAPTPKMSTYLLAFIVGNFEYIQGKTKNGVLVRVFATPGKKKQSDFALRTAIKCLEYYEKYFDIKYPLPVIDLIAIPDFAAGAMENWGAVTYRESALLIDPDHSSIVTKQRVALVICHELAHQWFGNLVTMEWWTDLWLNEGFASYAEYMALDHIFPEWNVWDQFVYDAYSTALQLDSLKHTHPIEIEVHHPSEIDEIFDDVSYSKGASIIRMLADYLGEANFRNGLRHYLKKHAYGNAVTTDLWKSFEAVSDKPVTRIMQNWTGKPGYPVVKVEHNQGRVTLKQNRFFSSPLSEQQTKDSTLWQIPVAIRYSTSKKDFKFLMDKKSIQVPGIKAGEWMKVNIDQSGYFRTNYDHDFLVGLQQAIRSKKIPAKDRLGIVIDAFALAESGRLRTVEVLELLEAYINEDEYTVWVEIIGGLSHLAKILEDEKFYPRFEEYARGVLNKMIVKVGWSKKPKESHSASLLRTLILGTAIKFGHAEAIAQARKMFAAWVKGKHIDPDLRGVVYGAAAKSGGSKEYNQLLARYKKEHMHEEKNRIGRALTMFSDQKLIRQALDFGLSKHVRLQDAPSFIALVTMNRYGKKIGWNFLKQNWKKVLSLYGGGGHALPRIVGAMQYYASDKAANDIEAFFKKNPAPGAERAVQQVLEHIRSNAHWLKRDREEIKNWL